MPWPVYYIAGGLTFLPGAASLALAGAICFLRPRRWLAYLSAVAATIGIAMVIISAEALPITLYVVWTILALAWIFRGMLKQSRARLAISAGMLAVTAAAAGVAIFYRICPTLPLGNAPRMYVIGDSISAPVGTHDVSTWSGLIAAEHGVQVVNLARAGSMISDAANRLKSMQPADGIVLIEIGGNDMIAKADPRKFGRDLDALAHAVQGPGRTAVMLELPLFPFGNAYGMEQRRVASKYHILLIPRGCFASVLMPRNATIDGIHLTPIGHRRMAELVWKVVGVALASDGSRPRD